MQDLRKEAFSALIIMDFKLNRRVYVKTKTLKNHFIQQPQYPQLLIQSPQWNNLN